MATDHFAHGQITSFNETTDNSILGVFNHSYQTGKGSAQTQVGSAQTVAAGLHQTNFQTRAGHLRVAFFGAANSDNFTAKN